MQPSEITKALDAVQSPFRNPVTNQRYLKGLFFETTYADKSTVVYSLKDRDHEGYPSLYRLYMEADDPTEYLFATQHLDGWDHWETLCQCTWFKPYIDRWRRELEIKHRALALANIKKLASDPDSKEFHQANKFLVNAGWVGETKRKNAGRPSKEEVSKAAKAMADEARQLEEDLLRIQGNLQ
ncbi:MAG: hypothetical protein KGL39_36475 [Patescibacteria group bacterium]|nr:hypothetical protein [Patescibacteria group bacterium]